VRKAACIVKLAHGKWALNRFGWLRTMTGSRKKSTRMSWIARSKSPESMLAEGRVEVEIRPVFKSARLPSANLLPPT
jgi:hypothetical protein